LRIRSKSQFSGQKKRANKMEFEVELETTRDYTTGFITDSPGKREEIRVERAQESLSSLTRCIEEGVKRYDCSARDLLKGTRRVKPRVPEIIIDTMDKEEGARTKHNTFRPHSS